MAARKLLSVGQFPLFNNSLKCFNPLKKDYSKKKIMEGVGFPPKPKRPPSSYLAFQLSQRNEIMSKNPDKSFGEISKMLGVKWKNMSEDEKFRYKHDFSEKFAEYKSQLKEYYKTHGEIRKNDVENLEKTVDHGKKKKIEIKHMNKENNKPEFPNNPYKLFVQQQFMNMDLPVGQRMQKCAELWRNMPEKEKENFKMMYQKKYEEYKKRLDTWEENMISQGKHQLVRRQTLKEKLSNK